MKESARRTLGLRMINGNLFDFNAPSSAEYTIEDVALVLGKKCRFSDHIKYHYSIAEHCCHAHDLYICNRKGALMHDAPEFIVDDCITPIKQRISGYKDLEESVMADMENRFDFKRPESLTFKLIDTLLFHIEESTLYDDVEIIYDDTVIGVEIHCWSPEEAARQFLTRFYNQSSSAVQRLPKDISSQQRSE